MRNILGHISLTYLLCLVITCHAIAEDSSGKETEGINESWLKTVLSIEVLQPQGDAKAIGTGFLLSTTNNHLLLITAKHVVADASGQIKPNLAFRFNRKSGTSILISDAFMLSHVRGWFLSTNADVACRFVAYDSSKDLDFINLREKEMLSTKHINPGASILIPGYPLGLRSPDHAEPIVRRGVVARVDDDNLVLDAFVFPGNSGGPVIYVPTIKISVNGDRSIMPFINEERLIGIISSNITYTDVAVSLQTRRPRVTFEENSGLCNVVPADAILALINRADVSQLDAIPDLNQQNEGGESGGR